MKIFSRLSAVTGILLCTGLFSCSDEFDVAAPYKNVTLVYSFLNVADTAHYVRVQKAFLDENRSAIVMAKVPDSSFYSSLEVRMLEIGNSGSVVSSTVLPRVDLAAEGFPKDTGIFFNTPSYAYKFKKALSPAYRYRVVVLNTATAEVDSGETQILDTARTSFNVSRFFETAFLNTGIAFIDTLFTVNKDFELDNVRVPPGTGYVEATITFHWQDRNIATGALTERSGAWVFANRPVATGSSFVDLTVPETAFYGQLRNIMGRAPNGVERLMDSADIDVWVSTPEYNSYKVYAETQGGLTGDQIRPNYTNLKGVDILGLFTARSRKFIRNVPIEETSLNNLKINSLTQELKIVGRSPI